MFTGFTDETIRFFLDIRFHNEISYFNANRERYEACVAAPFRALIEDMGPGLLKIDPQMELRPYKALARLRRDTRFTKDKSPYRDHLWMLFRRAAEPREGSLFYWFELAPENLGWGMGVWGENRDLMDAFRRKLAADPDGCAALIDGCRLSAHHLVPGGSHFRRIEVPAAVPERLRPWYTSKELYIARENPRMEWAYQPGLPQRLLKDFRTMAPIYRLLRGAADEVLERE